MAYLNLASVRFATDAEGPGTRFAIWVQGCNQRCLGCCNPEMQEIRRNIVVDTDDLVQMIASAQSAYGIEGVSLIGGEPILQAEGLAEVAVWCQKHGLTVLLFTGYLYEALQKMSDGSVQRLLAHTDLLVDGTFVQEQYDEKRAWVGSTNQRVWRLRDSYPEGIEYKQADRTIELMLSDTALQLNGWPYDILEARN